MGFIRGGIVTGLGLLISGCAMYKTVPSESIEPVVALRGEVRAIDYGRLSWEEVIGEVNTLDQAQDYVENYLSYDRVEGKAFRFLFIKSGETKGESFRENHRKRKGVCVDFASAPAALMSDNGYRPLILGMWGKSGKHMMYLYRTQEGFGVLGEGTWRDGYETISDLVKSMKDEDSYYSRYCVIDLDMNFPNRAWIWGDVNLQIPAVDGFESVE